MCLWIHTKNSCQRNKKTDAFFFHGSRISDDIKKIKHHSFYFTLKYPSPSRKGYPSDNTESDYSPAITQIQYRTSPSRISCSRLGASPAFHKRVRCTTRYVKGPPSARSLRSYGIGIHTNSVES